MDFSPQLAKNKVYSTWVTLKSLLASSLPIGFIVFLICYRATTHDLKKNSSGTQSWPMLEITEFMEMLL